MDNLPAHIAHGVLQAIEAVGATLTYLPAYYPERWYIALAPRPRGKIENESFNVLKNNGYHLERNFGRGKGKLAMKFVP